MRHEEDHEQMAVALWLDTQWRDVLWTASAGGMRTKNIQTARRMKRMGYKKGCPDILIFEPRGKYHGLLVEMKRSDGGTKSSDQKEWVRRAVERGYKAAFAEGYEVAVSIIDSYLKRGE